MNTMDLVTISVHTVVELGMKGFFVFCTVWITSLVILNPCPIAVISSCFYTAHKMMYLNKSVTLCYGLSCRSLIHKSTKQTNSKCGLFMAIQYLGVLIHAAFKTNCFRLWTRFKMCARNFRSCNYLSIVNKM